MKSLIDETIVIRNKYIDENLYVSYITNGKSNYISIETKSEDKSDIEIIHKALKEKFIMNDNKLRMNLENLDYEDSPGYYMTDEVEAIFNSVYVTIKNNIEALRSQAQTVETV